ncbi:MAG: glutamyl-tRNA amidotransferase [Dehalococcoidia bacterium SM23_28_2]|nr:MAG: glutamyl-tRNA amidotransferase [Dehalococcoidia bacterium SM23_28_2]
MAITREEVQHVAMLFRMSLSEEEIAKFQQQLSQIIDYFQILQELDTEGVPPTSNPLALENVMRDDEPRPSFPTEDILANAPRSERDFFRVRAVLE